MLVKWLVPVAGDGICFAKGDVSEISDDWAQRAIAKGHARACDEDGVLAKTVHKPQAKKKERATKARPANTAKED